VFTQNLWYLFISYWCCCKQPKFVIHCAAERRPDVMAKNVEAARELNIGATRIVCEEAGTYYLLMYIYLCVFFWLHLILYTCCLKTTVSNNILPVF